MEGPVSFWGYKEQESNLILPEHDDGDGLYTHVVTGRCPGWVETANQFPPSLDNGRSPHEYINQRLQIQFGDPDEERYAARKMLSLQ
jgi:hypothetical protein